MAIPLYPPNRDADVLAWSANFATKITDSPVPFGLTAPQAVAFTSLQLAYASSYETAIELSTNSRSAITAKNTAKANLMRGPGGAKELVAIVQAFPGTTDEMRTELGLRVRDADPTPVPAPKFAPTLTIVHTIGRSVRIRLRDAEDPASRGKPIGVRGATVLTFVGEEAPTDPLQWVFALNTSKPVFDLDFPTGIEAGTRIWMTAVWFNNRMETSPPAVAQSIRLSDSPVVALSA